MRGWWPPCIALAIALSAGVVLPAQFGAGAQPSRPDLTYDGRFTFVRLRWGADFGYSRRGFSSAWNRRCSMNQELRCVFVASGEVHAQQVRAFLEAAGIPTALRGESLRNTHGLTLDGLGAVEIEVTESDAERARALLASADAGQFRLPDDVLNHEGE